MEQQALKLLEYRHPDKAARRKFEALIGIDAHKTNLLSTLHNILDRAGMEGWLKKYHSKGLPYLENLLGADPLIILSGDAGCGKTELAHTIGSPLSDTMGGETIVLYETPSDIRGGGHVGEVSKRITEAFRFAKENLRKGEFGILLIDEADDLATSRDQMQAHHEDRSGVNVLIKEIDKVKKEKPNLAVILITNRPNAIDPAVMRRASLHLRFERPDVIVMKSLITRVFEGLNLSDADVDKITAACNFQETPYSYSDITNRVAKQSLITAKHRGVPLSKDIILEVVSMTEPSPLITQNHKV